jgi:glyoxylase-like metal-dependent hydrolase (beta-lactamase superfamily II)
MEIKTWYEQLTSTLTYCVYDPATKDAIVIDPVWDYDPASGALTTSSITLVIDFIRERNLNLRYILETHAHADHISGAQPLKKAFPSVKVAIGEGITDVQKVFKKIFNFAEAFPTDGRQFDLLLKDGDTINAGSLSAKVIATPGHTPACVSILIGDAVFTGDALFMPDQGTGRCDFPEGSAERLFDSIKKLYALPDRTRVFVGHDYQPGNRDVMWESTISDQKRSNIQLKDSTARSDYITARQARDKQLAAPRLLLPSIQVNIDGGRLPAAESNGVAYLKMPVKIKS